MSSTGGFLSSAQALLRNFAAGEARLDVADAALQIGAEDDALVSHSPVALPVPFLCIAKRH